MSVNAINERAINAGNYHHDVKLNGWETLTCLCTEEAEQLETERTMDNHYNQKDDQQETTTVQPFKENVQGPTFGSVQVTHKQQHQSSAEDSLESYQPKPFQYHLYDRPRGIIDKSLWTFLPAT